MRIVYSHTLELIDFQSFSELRDRGLVPYHPGSAESCWSASSASSDGPGIVADMPAVPGPTLLEVVR